MSSTPAGIDPKTLSFFLFQYTVDDGVAHLIRPEDPNPGGSVNGVGGRWMVSKVCAQAAAVPAVVRLLNFTGGSSGAHGVINLQAGGSYTIEPNGTFREGVEVSGLGMTVIIEYYFTATPGGGPPLPGVFPP